MRKQGNAEMASSRKPLMAWTWAMCEMTVKVKLLPPDTALMDSDGWYQFDRKTWTHTIWIRVVRRYRTAVENVAATIGVAAHEFEHAATSVCAAMRVQPCALHRQNELRAYVIQTLTTKFSRKLIEKGVLK